MEEQKEIKTSLCLISGTVTFAAIPPVLHDEAVVFAAYDGSGNIQTSFTFKTKITAGTKMEYCLVVRPGTWEVWAEFGVVKSERRKITVSVGTPAEADFLFDI